MPDMHVVASMQQTEQSEYECAACDLLGTSAPHAGICLLLGEPADEACAGNEPARYYHSNNIILDSPIYDLTL